MFYLFVLFINFIFCIICIIFCIIITFLNCSDIERVFALQDKIVYIIV